MVNDEAYNGPHYNAMSDSVETGGDTVCLASSEDSKVLAVDITTITGDPHMAWRTLPNQGNWRRVGFGPIMAKLMAAVLNIP